VIYYSLLKEKNLFNNNKQKKFLDK